MGKEPLFEGLLEEVLSFFEHPLVMSRDAISRMKGVRQRFSFILMSYLNYYLFLISVCLIRPIGLTTTYVM